MSLHGRFLFGIVILIACFIDAGGRGDPATFIAIAALVIALEGKYP